VFHLDFQIGFCWWIVVGLIAGVLARALFPGRQRMGWIGTILLGMAGSLVGGLLGSLLRGSLSVHPSGLIASVIGALLLLWLGSRR